MITAEEMRKKWDKKAVIEEAIRDLENDIECRASSGINHFTWIHPEFPNDVEKELIDILKQAGYNVDYSPEHYIGSYHYDKRIIISW